MKILDLSAGRRGIWFDKEYPDTTYVDIRPEVSPTIVADARSLPPEVGDGFDLIVFDPPHVNFGMNANMSRDYGHHSTAEIRDILSGSAREAYRVSVPDALMALKWNDHDQKLDSVLSLVSPWWIPLFGQKTSTRTKHSSTTFWVMLRRATLAPAAEEED